MVEPIEITEECYVEIEAWLEEIYEQYPFKRIYENGTKLGYKGFIDNHALQVEEVIQGAIEVRIVARGKNEVRHREVFDKTTGQIYSTEVQGSLL